MILILSIFFFYFLLFRMILSITSPSKGIIAFLEGISATISTAIFLGFMLIPLLITTLIGLHFDKNFIPPLPLFTLIQIFYLFSSILFLYEITLERIIIRILRSLPPTSLPFVLLLLKFAINTYLLSFSISYLTPDNTWSFLTIVILSGINAWINYVLNELSQEPQK